MSDTAVTSQFYAAAPAACCGCRWLEATGEPVASSEAVAEHPAICVAVPAGQGDERTCVTSGGLLALWDTAGSHGPVAGRGDDRGRGRLRHVPLTTLDPRCVSGAGPGNWPTE